MHPDHIWQRLARLPAAAAHVYCCLRAATATHGATLAGGHAEVAAAAGLAQRTLQRHLPALVAAGLAEVDVSPGRPATVRVVGAATHGAPDPDRLAAIEARLDALEAAQRPPAPAPASAPLPRILSPASADARVLAAIPPEGVDEAALPLATGLDERDVERALGRLRRRSYAEQRDGRWWRR